MNRYLYDMSDYRSYFLKSLGLREDQLPGGIGDDTSSIQVSPEQLAMGIKLEMEHTYDPTLAREIALDHLTEDPEYYSHLKSAGMADELSNEKSSQPGPTMRNRLLGPSQISHPSVIAVAVRGTKTGLLPAGGYVEDSEKSKFGGWEKMKVLPQGGVVGDLEKARLGGLERVKNIKPNSQGAISDTPASDEIKSKGGHFTPNNQRITGDDCPVTSEKGNDAIHPMQVQQLGNPPIEDDGTTRNGKDSPAAAIAGVEGGSAPDSIDGSHPMDKFIAGDAEEENLSMGGEPDEVNIPDESGEEKETGPWGIELDRPKEEEEEKGEGEDVAIDIKENEECECGNSDMKRRFQQLANIKTPETKVKVKVSVQPEKLKQLRELVGRLNAQGKVTPILSKAQKYLKEFDGSK